MTTYGIRIFDKKGKVSLESVLSGRGLFPGDLLVNLNTGERKVVLDIKDGSVRHVDIGLRDFVGNGQSMIAKIEFTSFFTLITTIRYWEKYCGKELNR